MAQRSGGPRSPERGCPVPWGSGSRCLEDSGSRQTQLQRNLGSSPRLAPGIALECGPRGSTAARSFSAPG
eukprot:11567702-Alexandrium_andersonii.AAC.1